MSSGHIVKRGDAWRVMVYAGRDPVTGRKRQLTRTVQGTKKDAENARNEMLVAVQQGQATGTNVTFGELLDTWFESASSGHNVSVSDKIRSASSLRPTT